MEGNRKHSHWSAHHALLFVKDVWLLIFRFITAQSVAICQSLKMVRSIGASQKKWSGQLGNLWVISNHAISEISKKKKHRMLTQIRDRSGNWKFELTACTHAATCMYDIMEICKRMLWLPMAIGHRTGVGLVVVKKSVKVPTIN